MKNFDNIFNNEKRNEVREGDFKRKKDSGRNRFGNRDRDRGRHEMFETTCSDCGKRCEVPFKPTGDKPVYCSSCFTKHGGPSNRLEKREDRGRGRDRGSKFRDKEMFETICSACGKRCEVPFKPTGDKPVYCSECSEKGGKSSSNNDKISINQYKEQFEMLNAKLDRIIKALDSNISVKEEKPVIIEKKEVKIAVKKEKAKKVVIKKKEAKKPSKIATKKSVAKKKTKK